MKDNPGTFSFFSSEISSMVGQSLGTITGPSSPTKIIDICSNLGKIFDMTCITQNSYAWLILKVS